jgi:hypothetical protein
MIQPFRVAALQLAFDRFVLAARLFVLPARFDGAASVARPTRIDRFWLDNHRKEDLGRASP